MTPPTRPGTPARSLRVLSILVLLIAACGGGDSGNDPDPTTNGDGTIGGGSTTEATVGEVEPEEPTQSTQGNSESGLEAAATTAVLTFGGDIYTFAIVDDSGSCDPDRFGVGLQAMLTHVDENGEPVETPDDGRTEGIIIGLPKEGEGGVIAGNFGGAVWSAGEDQHEASSIDSVTFDGARVDGSATYMNVETGEAVEGTFEVTCAEDG